MMRRGLAPFPGPVLSLALTLALAPALSFLITPAADAAAPGAASGASPPNVVLIVADDLGYGDLGCYGNGINGTPHLDALAAGGLRFTDFHSGGAMCSPTRASLLTGRYPQTFGDLFDGALSETTQGDLGLPLSAVTLAELLREKGYATACLGKWHLGYRPEHFPTRQGFDLFRGLVSGDGDFHTRIDRSGHPDWWDGETPVTEDGYTTELLTQHAIDFVAANRERPFFLYLPHLAIHFPWQGPEDPPQRVAGESWHDAKWGIIPVPGDVSPHVKAMVESLDAGVGRVLDALREHGLEENTLVIFTSDNGGYLTYGKDFRNISSNGPYRGQKAELYEGGHRVPAIFSWPGRIPPGTTGALAHTNDLLPTIATLAGAGTGQIPLDGVDLGHLLFRGEPLAERRLYWRSRTHAAVREGPWKLVATRNGKKAELFRLDRDPGETTDLSASQPARLRELRAAWETWNREIDVTARTFTP